MARWLMWVLALLVAANAAAAQGIERPHAELPSADQPARTVPITGYTLALTWGPEYCYRATGARAADPQCRNRVSRSGFTLHGLWPDGDGPNRWPQYCHPVGILSEAEIRGGEAATPSPQLLQHEWAKHGSCMGRDAAAYFAEEGRLYRLVALPDMAALARRRGLTAGDVQQAVAAANPRLPAGAVRVTANKRGWLSELWLCLDRQRRFQACGLGQEGGLDAGTPLKIATETAASPRPSYRRNYYRRY